MPIPLQYWTDPLCIWAFVAQERLDRLLERHPQIDIAYHIVPVFGSIPHRFREGSWANSGPEGRAAATQRIASERGIEGVSGRVWVDDPPASSWPVGAAAKAGFAMEARDEADTGCGAAYLLALRKAFFLDDRNIAKRIVQLEVGEACGLDPTVLAVNLDDGSAMAALYEDHIEREALKLQGSPTWVFDGGRAQLYGNFDEHILDATVASLEAGLLAGGTDC
jgi:predicted DsbA family dithiol-disulfide isomerase